MPVWRIQMLTVLQINPYVTVISNETYFYEILQKDVIKKMSFPVEVVYKTSNEWGLATRLKNNAGEKFVFLLDLVNWSPSLFDPNPSSKSNQLFVIN